MERRQSEEGRDAEARGPDGAGYAYEENVKQLTPAMIREFRSHGKAWEFFQAQAPSYRKKVTHWVTSAKQEATRERRLSKLIDACEKGEI